MARVSDLNAAWVEGERAKGRSWSTLARIAGVPEIDLRRAYGGLSVSFEAEPRVAPRPDERLVKALVVAGVPVDAAEIAARLFRANGAQVALPMLCAGRCEAVRGDARETLSRRMAFLRQAQDRLRPHGLYFHLTRSYAQMASVGLAAAARLASELPGRRAA